MSQIAFDYVMGIDQHFSQVAWTWSNLRPTCKYCEMTRLGLQCLNDIPCHMNSTLSCIKQGKAHVINGAS